MNRNRLIKTEDGSPSPGKAVRLPRKWEKRFEIVFDVDGPVAKPEFPDTAPAGTTEKIYVVFFPFGSN